jgi:hypothetical protein
MRTDARQVCVEKIKPVKLYAACPWRRCHDDTFEEVKRGLGLGLFRHGQAAIMIQWPDEVSMPPRIGMGMKNFGQCVPFSQP